MATDSGIVAALAVVGAAAVTALGGVLTAVVGRQVKRDQGVTANPTAELDVVRAAWLEAERRAQAAEEALEEQTQIGQVLLLRLERLADGTDSPLPTPRRRRQP